MLSFPAGTNLSIEVLLLNGRESVVPDLASVYFTVYDNAGAAMAGLTNIAVTTDSQTTSIPVPVPSGSNGKTLTYEYRTVEVKYTLSGQTRFARQMYRLTDRVQLAINEHSCRALIGFAENELPDEDLDLLGAYYLVADAVTKSVLDAALVAGNATTTAANRAVSVRALLEVLPSLQMRANSSEKSQTASATRLMTIDFPKLEKWLTGLYDKARLTLSGDLQGVLSLMTLATPTDPVTGV